MGLNKEMFQDSYQMFIGGEWVDASDGATFTSTCTATGDVLYTAPQATEADIEKAVAAGEEAFKTWGKTLPAERASILNRIADAIDANAEKLAYIEAIDKNSPLRETTFIDVPCTAAQFRYFASIIGAEEGSYTQVEPATIAVMKAYPLGVVGQVVPWNFPLMIGSWKIAPALAAGNCIVFKPSSATTASSLELAKIIQDILPAGVFNVVTGSGSKAGQYLIDHPRIKKLSLTGSTETGYAVAKAAADKLIPATLELGGKSPNIFFADCNFEKAIDGTQLGILFNQGEVCAAGSRLFVQDEGDFYERFVAATVKAFEKINVNVPWEMTTQMVGPVTEAQFNKVMDYIEIGKAEGARVLTGGYRLTGGIYDDGFYIAPTLLEATNDMRVAQEEIFGPVGCVIKFQGEEDVVAMANDSQYGLAGAVWTQDINKAIRTADAIESGRVWVNMCSNVPSGIPFGGFKKSGYGREINKSALAHYQQVKAIEISIAEGPSGFYPQD